MITKIVSDEFDIRDKYFKCAFLLVYTFALLHMIILLNKKMKFLGITFQSGDFARVNKEFSSFLLA